MYRASITKPLNVEMLHHSELCRHCQTETSAMPYGKSSNCPSLRLSTPATLSVSIGFASLPSSAPKVWAHKLVQVQGAVSFAWVCTAVSDEGWMPTPQSWPLPQHQDTRVNAHGSLCRSEVLTVAHSQHWKNSRHMLLLWRVCVAQSCVWSAGSAVGLVFSYLHKQHF